MQGIMDAIGYDNSGTSGNVIFADWGLNPVFNIVKLFVRDSDSLEFW